MKKLFALTCVTLMSIALLTLLAAPVEVEQAASSATTVSEQGDSTLLAGRYHARKRTANFFKRKK
jgi:hypothetical protein